MRRMYYYKLTADTGGAPCVKNGLLSLAICKPKIRSSAKKGDLIFGFAASSLQRDNRLLYIAEVTETARGGSYYTRPEFARREDCIYEKHGNRFVWRPRAKHHGPQDLSHDLGRHPDYSKAHVLLSADFRYFGDKGTDDYQRKYPAIGRAVRALGRGHRVNHSAELDAQLKKLKDEIWAKSRRKVQGQYSSLPKRGVCHRDGGCGEVRIRSQISRRKSTPTSEC